MKIPTILAFLVCCFLFQGCEEASTETGDIQSVVDNIEGKWNWSQCSQDDSIN